jgi:hypothetical protein
LVYYSSRLPCDLYSGIEAALCTEEYEVRKYSITSRHLFYKPLDEQYDLWLADSRLEKGLARV